MKNNRDEMLESYDFSGKKGIRGKYAKTLRNGYSVRIYDEGKLVSDRFYAAIALDVREVFPDSKSINDALRKIISLVPSSKTTTPAAKSR